MPSLSLSTAIPVAAEKVFEKVASADGWVQGIPRLLRAQVLESGPARVGSTLKLRISRYGLQFDWVLRIEEIQPPRQMRMEQSLGFFDRWVHTVQVIPEDKNRCLIKETIDYEMPLGLIGRLADDLVFRRDLDRLLRDRQQALLENWA